MHTQTMAPGLKRKLLTPNTGTDIQNKHTIKNIPAAAIKFKSVYK